MNGWLCDSADKSEIAYAGNDGYNEELGIYYSWDSTVNNASKSNGKDERLVENTLGPNPYVIKS